jgi:hypothetical protein
MYNATQKDYYELKLLLPYYINPRVGYLKDAEFYYDNNGTEEILPKENAHAILNNPPIENNNINLRMSENMPLIRIDTQTIASNIFTPISIQLPIKLHNYIFITENTYEKCENIPQRLIPLYIKINNSDLFSNDVYINSTPSVNPV